MALADYFTGLAEAITYNVEKLEQKIDDERKELIKLLKNQKNQSVSEFFACKFSQLYHDKVLDIPEDKIALIYQGNNFSVLEEGMHYVGDKCKKLTIKKKGPIRVPLAKKILEFMPDLESQIVIFELKEGYYALHKEAEQENECLTKPGKYAWWGRDDQHRITEISLDHPEDIWIRFSQEERDYLVEKNILTVAELNKGILLHYYNNELQEVITQPGKYAMLNNHGLHVLIPVKSGQECLPSHATHPLLSQYVKTVELTPGQIMLKKEGLKDNLMVFTDPRTYCFWDFPDEQLRIEVLTPSDPVLSEIDFQKLAKMGLDIHNNYFSLPKELQAIIHYESFNPINYWCYLVSGNSVLKNISESENDKLNLYLWRSLVNKNGIKFREIPKNKQRIKISNQCIFTKDNISIKINGLLIFHISYPELFIQKSPEIYFGEINIRTYFESDDTELRQALQIALRHLLLEYTLEEFMQNRIIVQERIIEKIKPLEDKMGIQLDEFFIKDVCMSNEIKNLFSQVLKAEKEAQIKAIERRDETAANRSLVNTAKLLEEHPSALALRKLQALEGICEKMDTLHLNLGDMDK